ncbi:MAG: IS3 family transposase [Dactylosporangium sp.]|nr:IS3 family transposase [Dactylosporangium sp.]NNJ61804.1 IS3 family transposase [Dactylosporangium sp.]
MHEDRYAVALLLRVLEVPSSNYYLWLARAADPGDRDVADLGLLSNIYDIWVDSGRTLGVDRVHRQLRHDGIRVGRKRVERLMVGQGWQGAFPRRGPKGGSTVQDPKAVPAPDRVNRDFTATAPDRLWVADATRVPCGEGAFWLAAVRDVFSRRIVGWKTSNSCRWASTSASPRCPSMVAGGRLSASRAYRSTLSSSRPRRPCAGVPSSNISSTT